MDELLLRLERWYAQQCDGDWEHSYGIRIATLDNPGWSVSIDLAGSDLERRDFAAVSHGLEDDPSSDWDTIFVRDARFEGRGDPTKLAVILNAFLSWAHGPER